MKLRYILPLVLTASATAVSADDYQTFVNFDYVNIDATGGSYDGFALSAQHYFDTKSTLGPLAEFDYINTTSNVIAVYGDFEGDDTYILGGEYFVDNLLVGAAFQSYDGFDVTNLSLGYLINEDFLVKLQAVNPEEGDTVYLLSAQYNHQLDGSDYLGFSFTTDDDFDNQTYSSTYFTKLEGEGYLKLGLNYHDGDFGDYLSTEASYYFNKMTSASVMLDDDGEFGVGFNHFFNQNLSIGADYTSAEDNGNRDIDVYEIKVSYRF